MNDKYKELFTRLGYDVSLDGATYFSDVIEDVRQFLELSTDENEICSFISSSCLENAHFYYEIGLNTFNKKLNEFYTKRDLSKCDFVLNGIIYGKDNSQTIQSAIVGIAKYMNRGIENNFSITGYKAL